MQSLLRIRDDGLAPPAGALLLSPWCDLEEDKGGTWSSNSCYDYLPASGVGKFARLYAGKEGLADMSMSRAKLIGLPPMMVTIGGKEVLRGQIETFVETAREQGVNVKLEVEPDMVHVWQVFASMLKEGRGGKWFEVCADWIAEKFKEAGEEEMLLVDNPSIDHV